MSLEGRIVTGATKVLIVAEALGSMLSCAPIEAVKDKVKTHFSDTMKDQKEEDPAYNPTLTEGESSVIGRTSSIGDWTEEEMNKLYDFYKQQMKENPIRSTFYKNRYKFIRSEWGKAQKEKESKEGLRKVDEKASGTTIEINGLAELQKRGQLDVDLSLLMKKIKLGKVVEIKTRQDYSQEMGQETKPMLVSMYQSACTEKCEQLDPYLAKWAKEDANLKVLKLQLDGPEKLGKLFLFSDERLKKLENEPLLFLVKSYQRADGFDLVPTFIGSMGKLVDIETLDKNLKIAKERFLKEKEEK